MMRKLVAQRSSSIVGMTALARRQYTTHITEGIGKGKVVPLKFDYIRPVFIPPSFINCMFTVGVWLHFTFTITYFVCALVPFAASGGFSGKLPPEPKSIHK